MWNIFLISTCSWFRLLVLDICWFLLHRCSIKCDLRLLQHLWFRLIFYFGKKLLYPGQLPFSHIDKYVINSVHIWCVPFSSTCRGYCFSNVFFFLIEMARDLIYLSVRNDFSNIVMSFYVGCNNQYGTPSYYVQYCFRYPVTSSTFILYHVYTFFWNVFPIVFRSDKTVLDNYRKVYCFTM